MVTMRGDRAARGNNQHGRHIFDSQALCASHAKTSLSLQRAPGDRTAWLCMTEDGTQAREGLIPPA